MVCLLGDSPRQALRRARRSFQCRMIPCAEPGGRSGAVSLFTRKTKQDWRGSMQWICRDAESSGADEKAPPSKNRGRGTQNRLTIYVRATRPGTNSGAGIAAAGIAAYPNAARPLMAFTAGTTLRSGVRTAKSQLCNRSTVPAPQLGCNRGNPGNPTPGGI